MKGFKLHQGGFVELGMATKVILCGVLLLAIMSGLTVAYLYIKQEGRDEVTAQLLRQKVAVNARRAAIAAPVVAKEAAAQERIVVVTESILKEIPVYVKADDCPMPGGFRLLHDAAADGRLPDPAGIPDAASVPATDVTATVAKNYGICRQTAQRLTSLQEWVNGQAELKVAP